MANVANDFIVLARSLTSNKNYISALNMYMCAFTKEQRCKQLFASEFLAVLAKMNAELAAVKNEAAVFSNLEKAMELFPGNAALLNDTGKYLYKYGHMYEALCHFEKSLKIDSSFVSVEKTLNNIKTFIFPRSFYRILNDRKRNSAYRAAIRSYVTHVDSVIDIDAGTGLLAVYASECNPKTITACESSKPLAELTDVVLQDNRAQEVVIVTRPSVLLENTINRYSRANRKSVLLTDAFDAGLFGEYILQSLFHAWEDLLDWNSIIIPGKAEYFIAGVNCGEIEKKYRLCHDMKIILNIANMNVHTTKSFGDTYYSEDVHLYKTLKYVCEPRSLFTIDFNCYQDIEEKLTRQKPYKVDLTAIEDGEVNVVMGWFNLHLTDDIILTSDPRSPNKVDSYQQAIFYDVPSKNVRRNETMNIYFMTDGRLATLPDDNMKITRVSPESMAFLNDAEYTSMIIKSVSAVSVYLGQIVPIEEVDIVDLSSFPLFGVLMLRRGANSLICCVQSSSDKVFLLSVLMANNIPFNKVTILMSNRWSFEIFKDKKFYVIFNKHIDFNGNLSVTNLWIFHQLQRFHLISGGICLPVSVTVMGQLISSNYLDINNQLQDDNVECSMAKHVNRYRVSQIMHLDIARLQYDALSDVFEVASCDELRSDVIKVSVLKDGECNAVLCWYKVKVMENWNEIHTNRSNSFVKSMAHMIGAAATKVFKGDEAIILRCVDPVDRSYKLVFDVESD